MPDRTELPHQARIGLTEPALIGLLNSAVNATSPVDREERTTLSTIAPRAFASYPQLPYPIGRTTTCAVSICTVSLSNSSSVTSVPTWV